MGGERHGWATHALTAIRWCPLVQLLLLTGLPQDRNQRRGVARVQPRPSPVHHPPEARFKSQTPSIWCRLLGRRRYAIVAGLPRLKYPKGEFVFSTTSGAKPVGGFSKMKAKLDGLMLEELRRLRGETAAELRAVGHS